MKEPEGHVCLCYHSNKSRIYSVQTPWFSNEFSFHCTVSHLGKSRVTEFQIKDNELLIEIAVIAVRGFYFYKLLNICLNVKINLNRIFKIYK